MCHQMTEGSWALTWAATLLIVHCTLSRSDLTVTVQRGEPERTAVQRRSLEAWERDPGLNRFDAHGWWLLSVLWRDYPHQIMPNVCKPPGPSRNPNADLQQSSAWICVCTHNPIRGAMMITAFPSTFQKGQSAWVMPHDIAILKNKQLLKNLYRCNNACGFWLSPWRRFLICQHRSIQRIFSCKSNFFVSWWI